MNDTPNGGPAFPSTWQGGDGKVYSEPGMSLRDYFAAKAMQGWIGAGVLKTIMAEHQCSMEEARGLLADGCYLMAAAMLRARAAQSPAETMRAHLDTFGGK